MTRDEAIGYAMYSLDRVPLSPLNVWLCVFAAIAIVAALMAAQNDRTIDLLRRAWRRLADRAP